MLHLYMLNHRQTDQQTDLRIKLFLQIKLFLIKFQSKIFLTGREKEIIREEQKMLFEVVLAVN